MEVIVLNGQSLIDVAIQHTGSVASIVDFAVANNMSITQNVSAGTAMDKVDVRDSRIAEYYSARKLTPATLSLEKTATKRRGIGNMTVGQDFIVG